MKVNVQIFYHPETTLTLPRNKQINTVSQVFIWCKTCYAWTGWTGWNERLPRSETRIVSDKQLGTRDLCRKSSTEIRRQIGGTMSAQRFAPPPSKRREGGTEQINAQNRRLQQRKRDRQRHKRDHWCATKTKRLCSKFSDKVPGIRELIGHHRDSSFIQIYT